AHQDTIGLRLAGALSEDLSSVGIEIPKFIIENISVPPEVEAALDKRTQIGIVVNLDQYTKFQAANALEDAANNPGGAGEGLGLGLGMAVGQRAAAAMTPAMTPAAGSAGPPPLPTTGQWYVGIAGQQQGPFDLNGLAGKVSSGELTPGTLVWQTGMAGWVPAQQV